jgi:legume-like lectin family protein
MGAGDVSRGRCHGGVSATGGLALALLVAVALVVAAPAGAGAGTIDYPDFSSVAGLALKGNAGQSGSALRLVPSTFFQAGSAWAQTPVDATKSFESRFSALAHDGSSVPGDGLTFTVQSEGNAALGGTGSDHGYGGTPPFSPVSPSVAVDVSLYPQILTGKNEQVAIAVNGNLKAPLATATSDARLYGQPFWVWVDYDATAHVLQVFLAQSATKPGVPLVSAAVDIAGAVGSSAYAGFTASTGISRADFDLLGWTFQGSLGGDTTPPTVTCSASPAVLWPPNNKFVPVTTTVTVTDADSGPAGFTLLTVTSNEGDAGTESRDWTTGTPDTSGSLQASRLGGGNGRVYTLTYQGSDNAGNTAACSTTVTVPHDQGKS